ncbi:hypothetical protein [Pseudorhodoplanes sp.]|uniref:hypothetical protein n=1 Tax=Pseudorhodoplanes sp. TaxID=1934341 RepID=UPI003D11E102
MTRPRLIASSPRPDHPTPARPPLTADQIAILEALAEGTALEDHRAAEQAASRKVAQRRR